jgi:hypothetical protein
MKTQQEILDKIESAKHRDFLGFETSDYIDFLDFKHAKQYLKKGIGKKKWAKFQKTTDEDATKCIKDYMPFAWEKANNCRGISACRSICHMTAWIWLLGKDDLLKELEKTKYEHYGKEKLIIICKHFKIDWKQYDNGIRWH